MTINLPKYVLGCLNSKACQYYYSTKFKSDTDLFPKIRIKQVRMLPIPKASISLQNIVVNKVDEILDLLAIDIDTNILSIEQQIDFLVYHLYGLTYDEVLVVDPDTPITREEYEAYKGE